jgi:HJR/Mrr/RecB family endonuclease
VWLSKILEDLFRFWGFWVETTKTSGDQGVDLIIIKGGRRGAIQAKGYPGSTVGNKAVQEAHTGKTHYACDYAVVITNSTFTRNARELAGSVDCILIEGAQIPELIEGRIQLG